MLRSRTAHAAFHLRRLSASTFASTAPTLFSAACLLSLSAACLISRPIGVEPPSLLWRSPTLLRVAESHEVRGPGCLNEWRGTGGRPLL